MEDTYRKPESQTRIPNRMLSKAKHRRYPKHSFEDLEAVDALEREPHETNVKGEGD